MYVFTLSFNVSEITCPRPHNSSVNFHPFSFRSPVSTSITDVVYPSLHFNCCFNLSSLVSSNLFFYPIRPFCCCCFSDVTMAQLSRTNTNDNLCLLRIRREHGNFSRSLFLSHFSSSCASFDHPLPTHTHIWSLSFPFHYSMLR